MTQTQTQAKPAAEKAPAKGTAVAKTEGRRPRSVLLDMATRYGMEPEAFEQTLRATVVPQNCTRPQFAAFLLVARDYDLNPLLKQIYAFPTKGGGIQPIVGVDGWIAIAQRHPQFNGYEFEFYDSDNPSALPEYKGLAYVTCKIWRKDWDLPGVVTEFMDECFRSTEPWKQWPRRMLRHKALIQGIRTTFGITGIVDPDEAERMAQADALILPASGRADVPSNAPQTIEGQFEEIARGGNPDMEDKPAKPATAANAATTGESAASVDHTANGSETVQGADSTGDTGESAGDGAQGDTGPRFPLFDEHGAEVGGAENLDSWVKLYLGKLQIIAGQSDSNLLTAIAKANGDVLKQLSPEQSAVTSGAARDARAAITKRKAENPQ